MDEELQKMKINWLSALLGAIYVNDFRELLTNLVLKSFHSSHNNTNLEFGFGGTKADQNAIDYLRERIFILSDKTASKLQGDLRFELIAGLEANEGIGQITKRLSTIFDDMLPYQLERLARTETLNAMNAGRMSAYKTSGVVEYKMWKAAMNNARTAADSKRLNGQIQKLDDPFVDTKTGESFMHPPNRPQCRCGIIPLRKLPEIITVNGQMYAKDEHFGKIEIPISLLKFQQKRKAWVVRFANGHAVQCFEDEVDADYFIETSKKKDAGWFDFNSKVYREVKSGWVINKKGMKITFKLDGENKKVDKIEVDTTLLNKNEGKTWVKETSKRKGHWRKKPGKKNGEPKATDKKLSTTETSMTPANVDKIESFESLGIAGGMHYKDTYMATFKDGSKGIYKVLANRGASGEVNNYNISNMLGFNKIPETTRGDFGKGDGSCQKWIPDTKEFNSYNIPIPSKIKMESKYFNDLSKILLCDMINGNNDRHEGNVIVKNDECFAIDNEDWGQQDISDFIIEALDYLCGADNDGELLVSRAPIFRWVMKNLSVDDYKLFREHLIDNMKNVIDNKEKLIKYYDNYNARGDNDTKRRIENNKENINWIVDYYNKRG